MWDFPTRSVLYSLIGNRLEYCSRTVGWSVEPNLSIEPKYETSGSSLWAANE